MPNKLAASTMSAPCMALASPEPCHKSPPSSSSERQDAGKRGSAREVKKVSAADGHARSPPFAKAHFLPRLVSSKGSCLAKAHVLQRLILRQGSFYLECFPGFFFACRLEDRSFGQ